MIFLIRMKNSPQEHRNTGEYSALCFLNKRITAITDFAFAYFQLLAIKRRLKKKGKVRVDLKKKRLNKTDVKVFFNFDYFPI